MSADPLTPAWIAARLTPAQREALLWLPKSELLAKSPANGALVETLESMEEFLLAPCIFAKLVSYSSVRCSATPLGLRVRAVVAGEAGRG